MIKRLEVTRTKKGEPHEYIETIGGPWGTMSAEDAIAAINTGKLYDRTEFFVRNEDKEVDVIVVKVMGKYQLKTKPDGILGDNLDNLPDC